MTNRTAPWLMIFAAWGSATGCSLVAGGILNDALSSSDASTADVGGYAPGSDAANDSHASGDADATPGVDGSEASGDDTSDALPIDAGEATVTDAPPSDAPMEAADADSSTACDYANPDCQNPACIGAGFRCVPAAPSNWTNAALPTSGGCDGGTVATALEMDPDGTAPACACGCTVSTQPKCTSGQITMGTGNSNCATPTPIDAGGGACVKYTLLSGGGGDKSYDPPPPVGGSCSGTDAGITIPPATWTNVVACEPTGNGGSGCPGGQVCTWGGDASACVIAAGANPCPGQYTHAHVAGSSMQDTRGCSACTACQIDASCTGQKIDYFSDTSCVSSAGTILLPTQCTYQGGSSIVIGSSFIYSASSSSTCTPGTSSPTGGVAPTNPLTICCE